jgi:hypothetical protein
LPYELVFHIAVGIAVGIALRIALRVEPTNGLWDWPFIPKAVHVANIESIPTILWIQMSKFEVPKAKK